MSKVHFEGCKLNEMLNIDSEYLNPVLICTVHTKHISESADSAPRNRSLIKRRKHSAFPSHVLSLPGLPKPVDHRECLFSNYRKHAFLGAHECKQTSVYFSIEELGLELLILHYLKIVLTTKTTAKRCLKSR